MTTFTSNDRAQRVASAQGPNCASDFMVVKTI